MATTAIAHPGYEQPARARATAHQAQLHWPVRWAFYAFIFSLPFGVFTLPGLTGMVSVPRVLGVVLLVAAIIEPGLRPWRTPKTLVCFGVFAFLFTLASFGTQGFQNLPRVFRLIQLLVLFSISYNLFLTGRVNRGALLTFVLSCSLVAALTLLGITSIPERVEALGGRLAGLGMDENAYALSLVFGIILCVGITYSRKEARPIPALVAWPIMILLLVGAAQTGSRGAAVALVAGIATLVLKYGSFWTKLRNVVLIAGVSMLAFWLYGRSEVFVKRMNATLERGVTSGRIEIFQESWKMAAEKPIIGWGPVVSEEQLAIRRGRPGRIMSTHNTFLAVLLDLGIVGIVPFYFAVFACWLSAWRGRRGVEDILPFAVCMATLAIQLSLERFWSMDNWLFFAYALASGHMAARRVSATARRRLARVRPSGFRRSIEPWSATTRTSGYCRRRAPQVRIGR